MLRRKHNWSGFAEYMKYEELEKVFLDKPGAWLDYPFGQEVAVFKIGPKMFGFIAWNDDPLWMNLKCDPDDAIALREMFQAVQPGYHMNKQHWNTVTIDGSIPEPMLNDMVERSYQLVLKSDQWRRRRSISKLHR